MHAPRWFWVGMLVLSVLAVRAVYVVPYIPTNDGPQNVLSARMTNHFGELPKALTEPLKPAPQFAYKGFALIYGPLERVMSWDAALRLSIAVIVIGFAWAYAAFVLALSRERRFTAYLGFVLAFMWPLYMGFFSFVVGTAIGLAVTAVALEKKNLDLRTCIILSGALLVCAVAHVFTAVLAGIVVGALVLARAERSTLARDAGKIALVGAPACALLVLTMIVHDRDAFHCPWRTIPIGMQIATLPRLIAPGASWRAWIMTIAIVAAVGFTIRRWRSLRVEERTLFVAGVAMLVVGFLAPLDFPNWQYFSPRFLPLGAMLVLACMPIERARAAIAGGALFVFAAGSTFVTADLHRRLARGCSDAIGGLSAPLEHRAMNLPIVLDAYCGVPSDPAASEVPWLAPLYQLGALYAVGQDSLTPYLFVGSPAVHAFTRSGKPLPLPVPPEDTYRGPLASRAFASNPTFRRAKLLELAVFGTALERIVVAGARESDVALFEELGFVPEYRSGTIAVMRFVPCHLDVMMTKAAASASPRIDVGLGHFELPVVDFVAGAPLDRENPLASVEVKNPPCGPAWVRVRIPTEKGIAICTNAGDDGRMAVTLRRDQPMTLACEGL